MTKIRQYVAASSMTCVAIINTLGSFVDPNIVIKNGFQSKNRIKINQNSHNSNKRGTGSRPFPTGGQFPSPKLSKNQYHY